MTRARLACTVRGCGLPLELTDRTFLCPKRHAYDVARSGYVNLLQPQDRRSTDAGDAKDVVDARIRLFDEGLSSELADECVRQITAIGLDAGAQVADVGCGAGDLLAVLTNTLAITGVGIDLSVPAIDRAARRHPRLTWVVANADRGLPLPDRSTAALLSINARRNPPDCARVLMPGGCLLVAVPAADDLIELRASVQGAGLERDRIAPLVDAHAEHFQVAATVTVRGRRELAPETLRDLLRTTYRGARRKHADRIEQLGRLVVTLASDLVVFRTR